MTEPKTSNDKPSIYWDVEDDFRPIIVTWGDRTEKFTLEEGSSLCQQAAQSTTEVRAHRKLAKEAADKAAASLPEAPSV